MNVATPVISSKTPNAVPRRCSGAASATAAASKPCVTPICRPHSPPPSMVIQKLSAPARTRFARISVTVPIPELHIPVKLIRENAEWIGGRRIDQIHHDQHDRHQRGIDVDAVGLQDKEGWAESRQR